MRGAGNFSSIRTAWQVASPRNSRTSDASRASFYVQLTEKLALRLVRNWQEGQLANVGDQLR